MTTATSLSQSMDRAVKHYSSLFKLPSYRRMLLLQVFASLIAGLLSAVAIFPFAWWPVSGSCIGIFLFLANFVADQMSSSWILKSDSIYDLRRITGLSLFSLGLWLFFIVIGDVAAVFFGSAWAIRLCLMGFSAVIILRSVVMFSTSSSSHTRLAATSLLQPFSIMIPPLVSWTQVNYQMEHVALFFVFSVPLCLFSSYLFISSLDNVGRQTLRIPALPIFRAFLLNWIADLNGPFEEFLERLGENRNVEASLLRFGSSEPKAVIVIPSIHPGPFKNVGSSLLPSMLKTAIEKRLNCVACVPHGLLGHEFDLASQSQNQKIISGIADLADVEGSRAEVTPFMKVSNGLATACCQVFGGVAFISFTLAPRTTEDLPEELGMFVRREAEKRGLSGCYIVNAHNSIDGSADMHAALESLENIAVTCLERVASLKQLPFEVGAATLVPKEFSLGEGMGPGGITSVVLRVGEQKTAYVVIDGNNMVSGLREKILSALKPLGIADGEVFTTDTHAVSALILGDRGYHPVGEIMSHEGLIAYVEEATSAALSRLEPSRVACRTITIPDAKVIGGKQLEELCLLIDRTLHKAKRVIIPLFGTIGILLTLILTFI